MQNVIYPIIEIREAKTQEDQICVSCPLLSGILEFVSHLPMLPHNYSSYLVAFIIPLSSLFVIPITLQYSLKTLVYEWQSSYYCTPCYPAGQRAIINFSLRVPHLELSMWMKLLSLWNLEPWSQHWAISHQIYTLSLLQLLLPWLIPFFFSSLGSTGSIAIGEALTTSYLGWGDVANWTCSLHFPANSNLFSM